MGILIHRETQVIVQGMTGHFGVLHTKLCLEYGTHIVAGVTPHKGGESFCHLPIYDSVSEACKRHCVDATLIFVPPSHAKEAIIEASFENIPLIVCITEGIPLWDMMEVTQMLKKSKSKLIGPNGPGLITVGESKIGIMPNNIHKKGSLGILSRSGTLTYEAILQTSNEGIGQSTSIGIGGDPILGIGFVDCLKRFEKDPDTKAVLMIGEIGGEEEQKAALWYQKNGTKPLFAYIAGEYAPADKKMGHAGAIISSEKESAYAKIDALKKANVQIIEHFHQIGKRLKEAL